MSPRRASQWMTDTDAHAPRQGRPETRSGPARTPARTRGTFRTRPGVTRADRLQELQQRLPVARERSDERVGSVDQIGRYHAGPLVVVLARVVHHTVDGALLQEPGLECDLDGGVAELAAAV